MTDVIYYKVGDVDDLGAILSQDGVPMDLTGATVTMTLKSSTGTRTSLSCSLGGLVNEVFVPGDSGGVTVHVTAQDTAVVGEYRGEVIVTAGSYIAHIPSGNEYITFKVLEAL